MYNCDIGGSRYIIIPNDFGNGNNSTVQEIDTQLYIESIQNIPEGRHMYSTCTLYDRHMYIV